jgi:hypothetical protein
LQSDVRRVITVGWILGPLQLDHAVEDRLEHTLDATKGCDAVWRHGRYRTDVNEPGPERQLNIQIDPDHLVGV